MQSEETSDEYKLAKQDTKKWRTDKMGNQAKKPRQGQY